MKKQKPKATSLLLFLGGLFFFPAVAQALSADLNPEDYPSLDDKNLGHLRHLVKLSRLPERLNIEAGQRDEPASYPWVILIYTLGLTHYHYTPAYRELFQEAMDQGIQQLLGPGIGEDKKSTGKRTDRSKSTPHILGRKETGPLAREEVTFIGHLLASVGFYTMLFRDMKYTKPGALPVDYENLFHETRNKKKYKNDFSSLVSLAYDRYSAFPLGFVCEPNAVFLFCNCYPFYGFKFYDHLFRTTYFPEVVGSFKKAWEEKGGFLNTKGHFIEAYLIVQDFIWVQPSAYFDAWAGAWMHAWNPELITGLYPRHAGHWVKWLPDGTAYVAPRPESAWTLNPPSDFGHFAVYAAEMGDRKTVHAMLAYAEKYMNPVWDEGAYAYSPCSDLKNEDGLPVMLTPLAGNILLALARLNIPKGIYTTFNKPFDQQHFLEPFLDGVDYPHILVRQAVFDTAKGALIIGLTPGKKPVRTSFRINRLDTAASWEILRDSRTIGRLRQGKLSERDDATADLKIADGNTLTITIMLEKDTIIIIKKEK